MGKIHFQAKAPNRLEEENRRLKRELERVQQERDIVKKAVSIFSREVRWRYSPERGMKMR
ncbi:hypothetical protein KSC_069370 [Ktedonobacter sp. SOSP1-52]|nr:hypothetical protein KSC_069370 [Ktedonobacter sp. SOSP1-52]